MTSSNVSLEREGRVAIITLERPESLNAISDRLARELADGFEAVAHDQDAWVVVLAGAGEKAFCVGADLKERASYTLDDFKRNRKHMRRMFDALRALPQPTVASIFGYALGGGFELALSCDLIVAAEGTQVGLPEARVGLLPAGGGTQLLTRRAGPGMAKELIFTGKRIDVAEAEGLGIVYRVVPRDSLRAATMELAEEIIQASPVALREAKRAIDAALGVSLDEGIEIENDAWAQVIESDDRGEGIEAFNQKRSPEWRNR